MGTKPKMKSFFLIRLKLIEMLIDLSVQLRSTPSKLSTRLYTHIVWFIQYESYCTSQRWWEFFRKIEELSKSCLNASLHSRTLDRTGTNCQSGWFYFFVRLSATFLTFHWSKLLIGWKPETVSSINKSRLSRSRLNRSVSQSFSQRKYNHNPG